MATRSTIILALTTLIVIGLSPAAAGPPLICHEIQIDAAVMTIPFDDLARTKKVSGRPTRLISDVIAFLDETDSPLIHMETLRRTTLHLNSHDRLDDLLTTLMGRVLDREAAGERAALAWFDVGYFVQCYDQLRGGKASRLGVADGVAGYGWVKRAIALDPTNGELEFGAAMVTVMSGLPIHHEHVDRAKQLASGNDRLETNLRTHTAHWRKHGFYAKSAG